MSSSLVALPHDSSSVMRRARKPKILILGLLGFVALEAPAAVSTGTFIDFLTRFDVSQHAARSTLNRLVESKLVTRIRVGREAFYQLTERGARAVAEGESLVWREDREEWDGTWTLVTFSLPEGRRDDRYRLRSRLVWHGFGLLRSGVWVAPGRVDVEPVLDGLGIDEGVQVFHNAQVPANAVEELVAEAYDLSQMADSYRAYIDRWDVGIPSEMDALQVLFLLRGEWQQIVQQDPGLPTDMAPPQWPAGAAAEIFRRRYAELEKDARAELGTFSRTVALTGVDKSRDAHID